MHPAPTFYPQLSKFADHAVPLGLSYDLKPSIPSFTTIVSEPQKIKRFRTPLASLETPAFRKLAELQEPGLIFMETQAELAQPGGELSPQPPGIIFILEAYDKIITVAHKDDTAPALRLPPLLDPKIEAIVQEDITSKGLMPAPWGVPSTDSRHSPLSRTPARSHCRISRSTLGSAILWATIRNNHSWFTESKNLRMSASSTQFT